MQWVRSGSSSHTILMRLGWFFHVQLKGNVDLVSQRTGLAVGTLRRYMQHDTEQVAAGFGPHRLPIVLRILDGLGVNPARLAIALYYSDDEPTFWRLMSATPCIEERFCLQAGAEAAPKVDRRLIRLEAEGAPPLQPAGEIGRGRFTSPLQARFAWFLADRMKGRIEELHGKTGVAPATLRRYCEIEGAVELRSGPQRVKPFLDILFALKVSPPKLVVASHYSGNDDSFWMIMSSTLCAEEALTFRGQGDQTRIERKLYRLEDTPAPPSRSPLTAAWGA
jgi:hypothetical protein